MGMIGNAWKGANGFSKILFVLTILSVPTSIVATIMNVVRKPEVDFTKLNWKTKKEIKFGYGLTIPIGTIVKVEEGNGVDFTISYKGVPISCTINDLELC